VVSFVELEKMQKERENGKAMKFGKNMRKTREKRAN
jgi:hypothetical protein